MKHVLIKLTLLSLLCVSQYSFASEIKQMTNSVSTLGTLHDLFLKNPHYGLKDFISALEQFKPDLILTEVRPENPTAAEASIDGGIEQAIIYAYGTTHSTPVIPTDWFDDEFFALMMNESKKETPELKKAIDPLLEKYRNSFTTASLLELNSEPNKKIVREIYSAQEKAGMTASRIRNEKICENIKKSLKEISGKKVLIIYGMDHKYFIDDFISTATGNKIIPVSEWFDSKKTSTSMPKKLKDETLSNLKASETLLKKRIEEKYYSAQWEPKLKEKLKRFPLWIQAVEAL